jgi:putative ABC transport system permease protein
VVLRTLLSWELIALGLRDLRAHKLRSMLTALGVIFGVAAVICMLSIGEGASAETLEQIKLLGSENIILRSMEPPRSQEATQSESATKKYGLTRVDAERLGTLPHVQRIVLMRDVADTVVHGSLQFHGSVLGTTSDFFDVVNVMLSRGRRLSSVDQSEHAKVCVIGDDVARELFPNDDPLGKTLVVQSRASGSLPYAVVGVLAPVLVAGNPAEGLAARNINRDVYIPLATADMRYGDLKVTFRGRSREYTNVQLSDVYLHVKPQEQVLAVSEMADRVLAYGRPRGDQDYSITVPLALLQEAERAKRTRQIVLGSIAGISLLVGGIGIMNIMLASVTERTREIGIRRALGAKRHHITAQFLVQTLMLSVFGGIAGILLGVSMAWLLTTLVDWQTIIPLWGVLLSFGVSAMVGVVFGLYPARAAAKLDPIEALNSTARTA